MAASIKRKGENEVAGITDGKDYAVQGHTGGGVVIVNDDGKFFHIGHAHIDAEWTVTDESAKAKTKSDKAKAAASEDENKTTT